LYAALGQLGQDDRQNIAERLRALLAQQVLQLLVERLGLADEFVNGIC
jgi:hypothetical protein